MATATVGELKRAYLRMRKPLSIVLVFIPVLLQSFLIAQELLAWVPVWAWYPDPGYQYLLAAAALVSGGAPALVYHPGTSFQWLVGSLERIFFFVTGDGSFFVSITDSPETYAKAVAVGIGLVFIVSLSVAAWRLYRYWGLWPSLVFQLLILWGLPVVSSARFHLWPESLVLSSGILILALLAPLCSRGIQCASNSLVIWLGVVSGVGLAAKIVFFPLIAVVVIMIPRRRYLVYVGSLLATLAILAVSIVSRLPEMWVWFKGVALKPGRHGQVGDWSLIDNFVNGNLAVSGFLRWYVPVTIILLALGLGLAIVTWKRKTASIRPTLALAAGVSLAALMTVKQSEVRDLVVIIPALAALGAHVVRLFLVWVMSPARRFAVGLTSVLVASYLALHGVVHHENLSRSGQVQLESIVRSASGVERLVESGFWGLGYNVWTEQNALMFGANDGNMFGPESSDDLLNAEIRQRYPRALYFDIWGGAFQSITGESELMVLSCDELQQFLIGGEFGIIVESIGHVRMDASGSQILLSDGRATFDGPLPIGDYFMYRFTGLACDK